MKANHCIIVILLFSAHCTFSQHALKLGVAYQFADEGNTTTQQFKAEIPSYFKFRSAHKYMEAGLSEFSISSENSSGLFPRKNAIVSVTPFYEFGRIIGKAGKKVSFKAGGRVLFGNQFERRTGGGTDFEYTFFTTGLTFAVNPGVLYQLNERLSIDLAVPFQLINLSTHFYKSDNPQVPDQRFKNNGVEGVLLPKIHQFRVGVIYRLGQ